MHETPGQSAGGNYGRAWHIPRMLVLVNVVFFLVLAAHSFTQSVDSFFFDDLALSRFVVKDADPPALQAYFSPHGYSRPAVWRLGGRILLHHLHLPAKYYNMLPLIVIGAISGALLLLIRRHFVEPRRVWVVWTVVNACWLSLAHGVNVAWGMQYTCYIPFLCALLMCEIYARFRPPAWSWLAYIGLVTVSVFTHANGILVALFVPGFMHLFSRAGWWRALVPCAAAAVHGHWYVPRDIVATQVSTRDPSEVFRFFLAWLGRLWADTFDVSVVCGGLTLLLTALLMGWAIHRGLWRTSAELFLIIAFGLLSGFMLAVGRAAYPENALLWRYASFSLVVHVGVIVLALKSIPTPHFTTHLMTLVCVLYWFVGQRVNSSLSTDAIYSHAVRLAGHNALRYAKVIPDNPALQRVMPGWPITNALGSYAVFHRAGLVHYAVEDVAAYQAPSSARSLGFLEQCDMERVNTLHVRGWVQTDHGRAQDVMLVAESADYGRKLFSVVTTGVERPDLVKLSKDENFRYAGFNEVVSLDNLPVGEYAISAWRVEKSPPRLARINNLPRDASFVIRKP